MATQVQTAQQIYSGGADLTCFTNALTLDLMADTVEATTYCSGGAREYRQGLRTFSLNAAGFMDYAASTAHTTGIPSGEDNVPDNLGVERALTVCPVDGTEGSPAYIFGGIYTNLMLVGGAVGDMAPYNLSASAPASGSGHTMGRGILEANRTVTTSTATTGSNTLGAVATGRKIVGNLHVFTLTSGASLTVIVQSDDNSGFTSPTTRLSFTAATTRTGEFKTADGPITDDYWRVSWTIAGTTPSVAFACAIGIA